MGGSGSFAFPGGRIGMICVDLRSLAQDNDFKQVEQRLAVIVELLKKENLLAEDIAALQKDVRSLSDTIDKLTAILDKAGK
jgi:hypothetical protein